MGRCSQNTNAPLFSREGGSPDWVSAFVGKQFAAPVMLAEAGPTGPVARGQSSSRITWSTARLSPAAALTVFTTPAFSARRMFSIFIASTTASG